MSCLSHSFMCMYMYMYMYIYACIYVYIYQAAEAKCNIPAERLVEENAYLFVIFDGGDQCVAQIKVKKGLSVSARARETENPYVCMFECAICVCVCARVRACVRACVRVLGRLS